MKRRIPASQPRIPATKSSIAVLSPRLDLVRSCTERDSEAADSLGEYNEDSALVPPARCGPPWRSRRGPRNLNAPRQQKTPNSAWSRTPMPSLFISYRRTDSPDTVKLIHERLKRRLPRWEIFYDHESIALGEQFPERLRARWPRRRSCWSSSARNGWRSCRSVRVQPSITSARKCGSPSKQPRASCRS